MYLSFNSTVMSASQITDYLIRVVQPQLQTVDGVANAQILGGQTFAMRIWLDPTRMAARGVTANDVRAALAANNFTTAAGEVKSDFTQISVDALTSLDSAQAFGKLVIAARGDALVRLGDVANDRARPAELGLFVDLRWAEGGVHRRLRHARGQPADRDRRHPRGDARHPGAAARRPQRDDRLRFDRIHSRLDPRGRQDAGRGGGDRHRRHLPVHRQHPLDLDSDRHHSAVAGRGDDRAAGARLFDQSADPAGAGARHRPGGRRRDRGGGKHPPPYRGGHDAVRRGDPRRARDRPAGGGDDDHACRGLCADRLRLRRHRRAVSRIRLHPRRRGDRFRLHRADPVADDVLETAASRDRDRRLRRVRRPHVRGAATRLSAPPVEHAEFPRADAADPGRRAGADRGYVSVDAARTGAGGGPGLPDHADQGAAARQSRLRGAGDAAPLQRGAAVPEMAHVFMVNGYPSVRSASPA